MTDIAIENGHRNSEFSQLNMVDLSSLLCKRLPEGKSIDIPVLSTIKPLWTHYEPLWTTMNHFISTIYPLYNYPLLNHHETSALSRCPCCNFARQEPEHRQEEGPGPIAAPAPAHERSGKVPKWGSLLGGSPAGNHLGWVWLIISWINNGYWWFNDDLIMSINCLMMFFHDDLMKHGWLGTPSF